MVEYIEREAAAAVVKRLRSPARSPAQNALIWKAQVGIDRIPAADVVEVNHGRWIDRYGGKHANPLYECSECKEKALYKIEVNELGKEQLVQALSAICPNCGAKMDGR